MSRAVLMGALAAGLAVAGGIGVAMPARAADVPNLVGSWVPVDHAGADFTIAPMDQMSRPLEAPMLNQRAGNVAWTLRIDSQDGRALAGALVSPGGKEQILLGTLRTDGRRLVVATDFGSATGDVAGQSMELCWVDQIPNYVATSCTTYQRKPAAK